MGRWREIAAVGLFVDESAGGIFGGQGKGDLFLSGPSFAFLLVNCKEKNKRKKRKKELVCRRSCFLSFACLQEFFCFPKEAKEKEEKKRTTLEILIALQTLPAHACRWRSLGGHTPHAILR